MRNVFVFPRADLERVRQSITRLAREGKDDFWVIDALGTSGAIYVSIAMTADDLAPLYCDWEPSDIERLRAVLGELPTWSVVCDVSGRIPGDSEIRWFVLELLADGGVAIDDYSDYCWTAADIAADRRVGGLRFFDHHGASNVPAGLASRSSEARRRRSA